MEIEPKDPPGHAARKLRLHLAEVKRLSDLGYTIKQIRQAFCEAGVVIGLGTVQREVAKLKKSPARATASTLPIKQKTAQQSDPQPSPAPVKYVSADEFFARAIATGMDNPLFNRKKVPPP